MLKSVLVANATSCAVFGVIFVLMAPTIASILGSPPILLLYLLGAGLLVNAALLLFEVRQASPRRYSVLFFVIGDAIWVLTSVGLVAAGLWITTPAGIIWALCIAVFVGGCGVLQVALAPKPSQE